MRLCGILGLCCIALGMSFNTVTAEITEKPKELRTTRFILHENKKATTPYTLRYAGKEFIVHPNVFSPKFFPDTFWFEENIRVQPGDTFLEIGSGTGIISVMAAIKGARHVTAVDINPAAVKNTSENVFKHHVSNKFRVLEGDVFDPIPSGQKFDVIFWFAPFMHVEMDPRNLTDLERAIYDPYFRSLRKYLSQARNYLKPQGKLLLGFSPSHGQFDVLETLAKENGWSIRVVAHEEEQIPWYPGVDQVDAVTVMLIELNPNASGVHYRYDPPVSMHNSTPPMNDSASKDNVNSPTRRVQREFNTQGRMETGTPPQRQHRSKAHRFFPG